MKKTLTLFLSCLLLTPFADAQISDCQLIEAKLESSLPALQPDETGWLDLCFGEALTLHGDALFPENGTFYTQSIGNSQFSWSLGDGTILEGQNVTHTYSEPGAYFVNLFVGDLNGCTSGNDLHLRIRVAEPPAVNIVQTPAIAVSGSPVSLKANIAAPAVFSFTDSLFFNIPTPLPDGGGAWVTMPVMVSGYPAGATVQPGQIQSVCLNMEHSWMRDLEMWLTCPNGQTIFLHNHPGQLGGEVFLGAPFESDEGLTEPIPGLGYDYCWTPSPQFNQTWIQYANAFTPWTLPAGSYQPFQPLNNLIGCPLNGDWTFNSTDLWGIDNGYLFSWTMTFNTDNFAPPSQEDFFAGVTSAAWQPDNSLIYYSPDSIVAMPQPGSQYVFEAENAFGCATETAQVLEITPDCPTVGNVSVTCSTDMTAYVVSFEIFGGNPATYMVSQMEGVLNGNVFTSNAVPGSQAYTFTVSDGACTPVTMSGMPICNCFSMPGIMQSTPIEICGTGPLTAAYDNTNQTFDANDVLCFILHTSPLGIGNILAKSSVPTFSFLPASMNFGTTYYISALVGNPGFDGCVSLGDPCFNFSNGTPVTFFDITTTDGTANFNHPLCPGDDLQLSAIGGTIFQWAGPNGFSSTAQNPLLPNIGLTQDGTYTLVVYANECAEPDSNEILVEFACQTLVDTVWNLDSGAFCQPHLLGFENYCEDGNEVVLFGFDPVTQCVTFKGTGVVGIDSVCVLTLSPEEDTIALHLVVHSLAPLAASQRLEAHLLEVFPNPASGEFFVKYENLLPESLALYDWTGRLLMNIPLSSSPMKVSTTGLVEGAYLLEAKTRRGNFRRKVVVVR